MLCIENMILKSLVHYFSSPTYMKKVPMSKRLTFCQKATCQTFISQPTSVAVKLLNFCMIGDVSIKITNKMSSFSKGSVNVVHVIKKG